MLKRLPPLAIAFSGGVDSRFLCHAALLRGCDFVAIHITGPHVPARESDYARSWANRANIKLREIAFNPLQIPEMAHNSRRRCYFCKKAMLVKIRAWLDETAEKRQLCDGGNLDDLQKYRPGLQAAQEAQVISPLALAGLKKSDIRAFARLSGMENPDQPARPCLFTRFPYDFPISERQLGHVEKLESLLQAHLAAWRHPPDFRLRFCPEPVLQLERMDAESEKALRLWLLDNGLSDCQIQVSGNLSGFFDKNRRQH